MALVSPRQIEQAILLIRGEKVILDATIARLYGVTVGQLNQAVKRNRDRFPPDFMLQLTKGDLKNLRGRGAANLKSQFVISSSRWGGRRTPPCAFTEQGVAMLSSVLRSDRAVRVNIEIMRAFVRLRRILGSHADLARKLAALERKYDAQFRVVFDAIRELMAPPVRKPRSIGFHPDRVAE